MSLSEMHGKRIGQYELRQLLGEGGMGSVYRAVDSKLNRSVALKLMHPHIARQDQFKKRFVQEAQAIAVLDHPNIVKVFTFSEEADLLYLVMEFVGTGSLRAYLKTQYAQNKLIEVGEALLLMRQVASALNYAHELNMVHRDVKPDNVLLKLTSASGTGEKSFTALLTDFGLVKMTEGASYQTQGDYPMGTLPYMSPEQIRNRGVDGRTDIYALGMMMYELIVGRLPFVPKSIVEASDMHINQTPPRPSQVRPGIAPGLEAVILKAIAKDPNARYQTGLEMIKAIRDVETGEAEQLTQLDSLAKQSSQGTKVESLGTYLVSLPGVPLGVDMPQPAMPSHLAKDRVVIQRQGYDPQYIDLIGQTTQIGRDQECAVRLVSKQVSRVHAEIKRQANGSYTIADLGSTNKTFVDGVALLPQVPEQWLSNQMVSIGEFRLTLQLAVGAKEDTQALSRVQSLPRGVPAPPRSAIHETQESRVHQDPVGIELQPTHITLDAGTYTTAQVKIINLSQSVYHFHLRVQGIPQEWVTFPMTPAALMPGETTFMPLTFHPPRTPTSTAGTHNLGLRIASSERSMEIGRGEGQLTIRPYYDYSIDLSPARVNKSGTIQLAVHNKGNSPDTYSILGRDREAQVIFDPPGGALTVAAGQTEYVDFYLEPRQVPFMGTSKMFPLELITKSTIGQEMRQAGELFAPPRLPTWVAGLMTFLCLGLIALAALIIPSLGGDDDQDTRPTQLSAAQITATRQAELVAATQAIDAIFATQTVNAAALLEAGNTQTIAAISASQTAIVVTQTALSFTDTPLPITNTPIPTQTTAPSLTSVPSATPTLEPSFTPVPTETPTLSGGGGGGIVTTLVLVDPGVIVLDPGLFFPTATPTPGGLVFDPGIVVLDPGVIIQPSLVFINPDLVLSPDLLIPAGDTLDWGGSVNYHDPGLRPSVSINGNVAVEVHQQGDGVGDLHYRVGTVDAATRSVAWGDSLFYDVGAAPAVAFNGSVAVEVHLGQEGFGQMWYRVGSVDPVGRTIAWGESIAYDTGSMPSVAFDGTTLVEVHQGQDGAGALWYHVGTLDPATNTVSWGDSNLFEAAGAAPAVAFVGSVAIETHQELDGFGALWYRVGTVDAVSRTIGWGDTFFFEATGLAPSVAFNGVAVVEAHQGQAEMGPTWYRVGTVDTTFLTVTWGAPYSYDTGVAPMVGFSGTTLIEVHQGQDGLGSLWYHVAVVP